MSCHPEGGTSGIPRWPRHSTLAAFSLALSLSISLSLPALPWMRSLPRSHVPCVPKARSLAVPVIAIPHRISPASCTNPSPRILAFCRGTALFAPPSRLVVGAIAQTRECLVVSVLTGQQNPPGCFFRLSLGPPWINLNSHAPFLKLYLHNLSLGRLSFTRAMHCLRSSRSPASIMASYPDFPAGTP